MQTMLLLRSATLTACFLMLTTAVQAQIVVPDAEWAYFYRVTTEAKALSGTLLVR